GRLALNGLCEDCWEGGPQLVTGIRRSGRGLAATSTECPRCGEPNLWGQWLRTPPAGYAVYQVRWALSELDEEDLHFWLSGTLFIATSPQDAYQQ
nr:hypothetical protein [Tanacetum cinerariifolium]